MVNEQLLLFREKLKEELANKELVKLTISNPRDRLSDLRSMIITIVELKAGVRLNFVYRYKTKDMAKNFAFDEAETLIEKALESEFYNADLFTKNETVHFIIDDKGKVKLKTKAEVSLTSVSFSHDKKKERIIETGGNIYLKELGITNAAWEVRREMNDKYRQINQYIELIGPVIRELELPEGFHVADMGSGKGYLTFALYDYLVNNLKLKPEITGVELREDLVKLSNEIAVKANFTNLHFVQGTIDKTDIKNPDILIALHACDTATDEAIYRGIASGASLIVCAPCCHKQIRKEFNVKNELESILKHGILMERQAEIITDGIRAMIMEAYGYKTKVFEFISTEHTPKNLMITGKKVSDQNPSKQSILDNIGKIKQLYGIKEHYLEKLLGFII